MQKDVKRAMSGCGCWFKQASSYFQQQTEIKTHIYLLRLTK